MTETVLIVDDDPVQRRLLDAAATRAGLKTLTAAGGEEALELLAGGKARPSVIILDLMMPGLDGLGVLSEMRERQISVPVIVQTAQGGIETVVGAMRAGAFDFVVKPVSPDRLQTAIGNALKVGALATDVKRQKRRAPASLTFLDIVSASPRMERVLRIGDRAARSQIPVLIEGESGVGKELIARAIQGSSERREKPFVTVNCGALPENLVESILFGHEKGAFTGATDKHVGKFEEANGGTLFLDEVGELPLDIQVKLLRAIQEGEIDPVGSRKPVKVDIRLISATNRDLLSEVKAGRFREDLFYRLNVLPLTVPPLRERPEDIPLLARHFMKRFAQEENRPSMTRITREAESLLCAYDWPGNIRQLENAIFRAVVLAEGDELTIDEFPQIAAQMDGYAFEAVERNVAPPLAPEAPAAPALRPYRTEPALPPEPATTYGWLRLVGENGQVRALEELEADVIRFAIEVYHGRMSEVARRLGIGRSTLYRKLKDYGLEETAGSGS
ncbi:MAG: sigma-54 dependent transcriptional regulator [Nitratireductor sp.]|jgi:DNA-binding NtrC family response regulator|nr:sigma-54 dependent transcriptional regulator [Nitratireductor sp.]